MISSPTPSRHVTRRLALKGEPRITGDKLTAAQVELLFSRVEYDPATGCLEWQGATNEKGYGQVVWLTRCYKVHVLAWEWLHGQPVPAGKEIDHICTNRRCVLHTEACTHAENCRRITARDAVPLPYSWREARDAALRLAHLTDIWQEV